MRVAGAKADVLVVVVIEGNAQGSAHLFVPLYPAIGDIAIVAGNATKNAHMPVLRMQDTIANCYNRQQPQLLHKGVMVLRSKCTSKECSVNSTGISYCSY